MRHIASISFGKDSLAMVLELIRREYPIDEAVFFNTGMEFDAIYQVRDKAVPIMEAHGVKYTELKMEPSFRYLMLEKPVQKKNGEKVHGYSWCGGRCRWGTTAKQKALNGLLQLGDVMYVGIAADEAMRLEKKRAWVSYPLAEWGLTEEDCLKLCYTNGFFWEENGVQLYDVLSRASCWCCRNKRIAELRNMYRFLPKYWEWMKELQGQTRLPYRDGTTIFELEERFMKEASA